MTYPTAARHQLLRLLADILDYPAAGLAEKATQSEKLASSMVPAAAPLLRTFRAFAEEYSVSRLEEVYTGFFDLNPLCYPYVGYHLFGESYKRSTFLLALRERYRAQGFEVSRAELADRLSVVLRFLSESEDEDERRELIAAALIPTLKRMTGEEEPAEDASAKPPADSEPGTPQLEGHSEGEVLAGGFLLEMTEGAAASGQTRDAYGSALKATRLVLEALWPAGIPEPAASAVGGRHDD